ncbi:MAG TPA: hypothetical protein VKB09_12220 [Thermomicrobiales bacterium]|nr:hypothetical protein [Thermomicrobiales bacterium]
MLYPDNALLYEIVRTAHDPDPVRAARFRPFGYPTARRPLDGPPAFGRSDRRASAASIATRLAATLRAPAPVRRPAPVPCC